MCVTGGAGFIGSHIVDGLVALGADVCVIDDLSTGRRDNLAAVVDRIDFVEGSIMNADVIGGAVRGARVIFHEAAMTSVPGSVEQPQVYYEANATGSMRVLEAVRAAGGAAPARVVYAASSSAYGMRSEPALVETMVPQPASPYAAAKCAGELLLSSYAACYGISGVSLRYFNIFGPRQRPDSAYAAVIPRFIRAILDGERPVIYGDGRQTRDFTHVANVVLANLLAGASPRPLAGEVANVACGRRVDLLHLVQVVSEQLGRPAECDHAAARVGDVLHSQADITLAGELLGYRPVVQFEEGLQDTVASFERASQTD